MNTSKLSAYATFAAAFLATQQQADAQLIFTEVDPDKIVNSFTNSGLDLNGDGIDEIVNLITIIPGHLLVAQPGDIVLKIWIY
jgi:hypothetical protein